MSKRRHFADVIKKSFSQIIDNLFYPSSLEFGFFFMFRE